MKQKAEYSLALPSPNTAVTVFDDELASKALAASRKSPRGRVILPLHKKAEASLQRMLNAIQPDSYIRPHRHAADRGESLVVLRGELIYFIFDEQGTLQSLSKLEAGTTLFGIDIEGGVWHSFAAVKPDTLLFEVKPGPYDVTTDKEFAPWAPEEDSANVVAYLEELLVGLS